MAAQRESSDPAPASAFVIHVQVASLEGEDGPAGRVEHVTSGRAIRFRGFEELLRFVRATLVPSRIGSEGATEDSSLQSR